MADNYCKLILQVEPMRLSTFAMLCVLLPSLGRILSFSNKNFLVKDCLRVQSWACKIPAEMYSSMQFAAKGWTGTPSKLNRCKLTFHVVKALSATLRKQWKHNMWCWIWPWAWVDPKHVQGLESQDLPPFLGLKMGFLSYPLPLISFTTVLWISSPRTADLLWLI